MSERHAAPGILYRSPDLLVRKVGAHGDACCVVTFDSFTDFRTLDRPGFGEAFLDGAGVDAIHVIPRENAWYQHPEMLDAMASVHAETRHYRRVVSYGSSMGGYAALRFGGVAGAQAALALSPQFSIDPSIAPWEERWFESSRHFKQIWETSLPFPAMEQAYVAYDPLNIDRKHIALIAAAMKIEPVRLPGGGHPVTGYLSETKMLKHLVLSVCRNDLDVPAFIRDVGRRQQRSAQFLIAMADRMAWWRHGRRLSLVRQAVALQPDSPTSVRRLAVELRRARRFDEAIAMHRRSLELAPGHPNMMLQYSLTLERSGAVDAALAIQEELYAATDGALIYRPRLDALRGQVRAGAPSGTLKRPARWLKSLVTSRTSDW